MVFRNCLIITPTNTLISKKGKTKINVIAIHEECHGVIGIARDYESAVNFLFNENWLPTDICDEHEEWRPIDELLGDEWLDKILSWDIDNFNEFFEACFYLQVETVYDIH